MSEQKNYKEIAKEALKDEKLDEKALNEVIFETQLKKIITLGVIV